MDSCTISHAPVCVARHSQRAPFTGAPSRVSARASSASRTLRFRTAVLPSWRQTEWSAVRNSSWPLSAGTRCPVVTQDAVQFSGDILVGSWSSSPACFTGRHVITLPGVPSPRPWNRAVMKASRSACTVGPKASPMSGVTRFTDSQYCWSDFCSHA